MSVFTFFEIQLACSIKFQKCFKFIKSMAEKYIHVFDISQNNHILYFEPMQE